MWANTVIRENNVSEGDLQAESCDIFDSCSSSQGLSVFSVYGLKCVLLSDIMSLSLSCHLQNVQLY